MTFDPSEALQIDGRENIAYNVAIPTFIANLHSNPFYRNG